MSYCSGGKLEVTEKELIEIQIAHLQGQIKEKQKKLEELSKTKSPIEEAYKRVYGVYPMTDVGDGYWENFQAGYKSAQKDYKVGEWEPTPQTPERVADGLKEAFREAVKKGVIPSVDKPKDDFMDKMVAELKGKTLTDLIWKWWEDVFTTHEEWDAENAIEELVNRIERFLPKEQSAGSSQNAYVESAVEGFNDAIQKIKRKLR